MKPNKQSFTIHEFVDSHTESEIVSSKCFSLVGGKGHQGWALKDSVKNELRKIGYSPFGETKKMNWLIGAWDEIEKIMNARSFEHNEDIGTPMTDNENIAQILTQILSEIRELNKKWN